MLTRDLARARVRAAGLTRRQVRAQVRTWGRRHFPKSLRARYAADLIALWSDVRESLQRSAVAAPIDAPLALLDRHLATLRDDARTALAALTRTVRVSGQQVDRWQQRKYETELGRALGLAGGPLRTVRTDAIDADPAIDSWVRENVALIQGLTDDQADKIRAAVLRAQRDGTRAAELTTALDGILDAGANRLMLIARDQIGKLNGQLEKARQEEAGIDAYIWRTSGDERVRPAHKVVNGNRYTWAKPPAFGHPGQPIQCRCGAEPDLDWLFGDD